jgi:hypothetical protein
MSSNFLPGDIRFFREQLSRLNHHLADLNKNLVILSERVSDEIEETVPSHEDSEPSDISTIRPGSWTAFEGGSIFQVNSHLFMKTHQVSGERMVSGLNGKWAGFLEVIDREGNALWEIAQTNGVFETEKECKTEIEHITSQFLDEWDANTNPVGEDKE